MKNGLLLAVLSFLSVACQQTQADLVTSTFDASVQGDGSDCQLPLLDFGSRTAEVAKLVGVTNADRLYYAVNLEPAYAKAGTSLRVTVRKTTADEERICTTMGPAYPSITVTSAIAK